MRGDGAEAIDAGLRAANLGAFDMTIHRRSLWRRLVLALVPMAVSAAALFVRVQTPSHPAIWSDAAPVAPRASGHASAARSTSVARASTLEPTDRHKELPR